MNDEPPPSSPSSDAARAVHVELSSYDTSSALPDAAFFARYAALAVDAGHDDPPCELSIRLVDEREGRELNREWRAVDRPTNVLSFPSDLPPLDGRRWLGDLVFCTPVILAEAAAQGKPAEAHWAHLTVHGTLHLLGHDHEDDVSADAMEALETALLSRAGIADPYRVPPSSLTGVRS